MFSTLTTGRINNQLNIGNLHSITLKRHFCVMVRKQKGPYLPFLGYMHSGSGCLLWRVLPDQARVKINYLAHWNGQIEFELKLYALVRLFGSQTSIDHLQKPNSTLIILFRPGPHIKPILKWLQPPLMKIITLHLMQHTDSDVQIGIRLSINT